jgi:uncharacterized protein (UPF0210 family)
MIEREFYKELGKILYAIAKADGNVQDKEVDEVEKQILNELKTLKLYKDNPDYKEIILAKLSFANCLRNHTPVKAAASSFLNYVKEFGDRLDSNVKEIALSLINHVAKVYKGVSKEEEKLIHEIKQVLEIHH